MRMREGQKVRRKNNLASGIGVRDQLRLGGGGGGVF